MSINEAMRQERVIENAAKQEVRAERAEAECEKHFRWAYRLLIALAKRCQQDEDSMHAGQEWSGLVGSSHAMYLRRAREEAGIDHDEFLRVVREQIDVEDIYVEAL